MDPYTISHRSFQVTANEASDDGFSFSNCRQSVLLPMTFRKVSLVTPLQLGTKPSFPNLHSNRTQIVPNFVGCVSHVRVNKKVHNIFNI